MRDWHYRDTQVVQVTGTLGQIIIFMSKRNPYNFRQGRELKLRSPMNRNKISNVFSCDNIMSATIKLIYQRKYLCWQYCYMYLPNDFVSILDSICMYVTLSTGTYILTPGGGSHTHSPVARLAYICSRVRGSMISTHSHLKHDKNKQGQVKLRYHNIQHTRNSVLE